MWLYFLSGVLTLLIQKLCNSRIFPAQHLHPGLHNSRRKERSLSLKRAGRRAQTDKCLHTLCTDTHTNTSASAHWEAYPPPSSFASHSLARPCNRDSYIRRIFSGPRLLQRGKTSLCHNASHDHTSPELNVWEKQINDLHFESDSSSSAEWVLPAACVACVCIRACGWVLEWWILMTSELWRQRGSI